VSLESVTRVLHELRDDGGLDTGRRDPAILDPEACVPSLATERRSGEQ
jgi:hypothetical protein